MRTRIDYFKEEGFSVVGDGETPNKLMEFIKEHFPQIIRDNEVKLDELKAVLGLPIDEKVNGYGLNFIGRNVARSKYAAQTDKELKVNHKLSKNFDTTQNLVLKGDNLDTLKILKSHYSGKIKCIYIDPPYNTTSDEFIYPDKFDKEEAEVLGLANLSQEDMDRLEFSFGTKKSHNGWLSFMYPRLVLARDLLTEDGVIFISIDDNEQANLKLLCDEIFGEENFVANIIPIANPGGRDYNEIAVTNEYLLSYRKSHFSRLKEIPKDKIFKFKDSQGGYEFRELRNRNPKFHSGNRPNLFYPFFVDPNNCKNGYCSVSLIKDNRHNLNVKPYNSKGEESVWRWGKIKANKNIVLGNLDKSQILAKQKKDGNWNIYEKNRRSTTKVKSVWDETEMRTEDGTRVFRSLFDESYFDHPKSVELVKKSIFISTKATDIILDFFAGSGTTGHAVMQLNADTSTGSAPAHRKFILCQIDEPIAENKPAYQFCKDHNLEPVISSITIERLRRAGEKIKAGIEEENKKAGLFKEDKKQIPDIGFKVFDTVSAPELELIDGKISFPKTDTDSLSRIYNMLFSVGIDDPTSPIETIVEDSIYKIGNHYYITNSEKISKEDLAKVIANGKVFIDGWTASINSSLQHYKEEVEIVF